MNPLPDWVSAGLARYHALIGGLIIGTAAKYGLALDEGERITFRGMASDALLLGLVGLIAAMICSWFHVNDLLTALTAALSAVASHRLVRLARDRFLHGVGQEMDKLGSVVSGPDVAIVPPGNEPPPTVTIVEPRAQTAAEVAIEHLRARPVPLRDGDLDGLIDRLDEADLKSSATLGVICMTSLILALLTDLYAPTPADVCAAFVDPLNATLAKYAISSLNSVAAFLATVGVESQRLTHLSENLNYSAEALLRVFPAHFNAAQAQAYAHDPQRIANRVYANRMGNGDEDSGDGWLYRGAGLIGLTGKYEQGLYAQAAGKPLVLIGSWLRTPAGAADGAGWFWAKQHLNTVSAGGDMAAVTRVVNGGETDLADRVALFNRAKALLG